MKDVQDTTLNVFFSVRVIKCYKDILGVINVLKYIFQFHVRFALTLEFKILLLLLSLLLLLFGLG